MFSIALQILKPMDYKCRNHRVAWKLRAQKSDIMDTRNMECVWHALCTACCWGKDEPDLYVVPNCQYYHGKNNLNHQCITHWSSWNDTHIPQTGFVQKDILVLMTSIASDFHWVSPKIIGEIVNLCRNNQANLVHTREIC